MSETSKPAQVGSNEGLGLVEVLARREDANGSMCAILPSEWSALMPEVMRACVEQSPRMIRIEIERLRAALRDVGEYDCRGGSVSEAYDEAHGFGAWGRLFKA